MRDDDDALLAGAGEDRLQHLGVVGDHADRVHALGDQVLDGAHLERRSALVGPTIQASQPSSCERSWMPTSMR